MVKEILFEKYVAAGNDFVVVDNRKGAVKDGARKAKELCDRKMGVGADGLLLLESAKKADYRMRIFNPDGSQAEMCGNGVRCLAHFAVAHRIAKADHSVETDAGLIGAEVRGNVVKAKLTDPSGLKHHRQNLLEKNWTEGDVRDALRQSEEFRKKYENRQDTPDHSAKGK